MTAGRGRLTLGLAIAIATLAVAACGSASDAGTGTTAGSGTTAGAGSAGKDAITAEPAGAKGSTAGAEIPEALAANRAQANRILDQGELDSKLAELEGHPVVVNQWASWCPPCRAEFRFFQSAAEEHAASVAFVGIDMQDERGAAEQFLADQPVPYPSIDDPAAAQIGSLGGGIVSPTTVFIDAKGAIVKVFQGAYTSQDQLEQDIDRYLKA